MSPRTVETSPVISPLGSSLLVRANEGRPLRAFGHAIVVLLDGQQTGGKFTTFLFHQQYPPVRKRCAILAPGAPVLQAIPKPFATFPTPAGIKQLETSRQQARFLYANGGTEWWNICFVENTPSPGWNHTWFSMSGGGLS
jgi:hypothetical protein